jgi:formylglycine-generating enzyme required for sulfatase activity
VRELTWYGAAAYCDWLSLKEGLPRAYDHQTWLCNDGDPYSARGYRLPTEAEWECAARQGVKGHYPWGGDEPSRDIVNALCADGWVGWSAPVGSYPPAPADLDIYDLAGHMWEWCNDWHVCETESLESVDPVGPPSAESRVQRGGSWRHEAFQVQSATRHRGHPWSSYCYVGFRIARSVPKE